MRSGKCKTDLNNFDIGPGIPGPSMPGFGLNISVPGLDMPFPEGFPENIFDLLNKLKLKWPLGIDLSAAVDKFMRTLSQLLSNIMTQMSVFLALYNIIVAIIQMIVCIIEVLCGLIRKAPKKLRRLFRKCLPLFISIFPFLALIALILAILALILALIDYIVAIIRKVWDELKKNFENLTKAAKREQTPSKSAAMIAIARKIATVLCVLENIMLLFLIIASIIEIVKGIIKNSVKLPCDDRSSTDCECCTSCSDLLITPDTIANQIGILSYTITNPLFVGPSATETITMTADSLAALGTGQYTFVNLLSSTYKECAVGSFFPPERLSTDYKPDEAPYVIDIAIDGYTTPAGARTITIKDVILQWVDTVGTTHGRLTLFGGEIEDPLDEISGHDLLFFFNKGISPTPSFPPIDPPPVTQNCNIVSFKPNYEILAVMGLTTFDCNPEIINDKLALYATINPNALDNLTFPDIYDMIDRFSAALSKLREKINDDSIDKFRDTVNELLDKLKEDTEDTYDQAIQAMISPLYSSAIIDPEIQFISGSIKVSISFKNSSKQTFKDVIGDFEIPQTVQQSILNKLTTEVTLGTISEFSYESSTGNFIANITSKNQGDGILKVFYDNQQFGELVAPDDMNQPSSIQPLEYSYTFVAGTVADTVSPRRDETDTANQ
jgi:hypothetical protein